MLNLWNLGGHLGSKDCYDVYDARTAKGWIYDARDITNFTGKSCKYDARGTAHFTKEERDNQHRFVAHVIIHDLIEAEDVRGCFDERAS